jgi:rhodanese-related sulfurtransferase
MRQLTSKDAAKFLLAHPQALFVDTRSDREFRFVGHPVGARHVPWNEDPGWDINPNFVSDVRKLAGEDCTRPVVLICRDGSRVLEAGRALEAAGFADVVGVLHGFEGDVGPNLQRGSVNGWRCEGMPWETSRCDDCSAPVVARRT